MAYEPNVVVRCEKCGTSVNGKAHGDTQICHDEGYTWTRYTLVTCPSCESPFLLEHGGDRLDHRGIYWSQPRLLYPSQYAILDSSVPKAVAESYEETAKVFHSGAHVATAIMCRRTLEGVCSHLGAKGSKPLAAKLKELHESKKLDQRIYDWSVEVLKNLGNDAAHNVEENIAPQDAKDAIEFTRAIIEHLFVFEAAFQRFKARRTQAEADAKDS